MLDMEKSFTLDAFAKWMNGEALSTADFERIVKVMDTCPLIPDLADQARWAGLQVRFRSVLHERFMPKQGG